MWIWEKYRLYSILEILETLSTGGKSVVLILINLVSSSGSIIYYMGDTRKVMYLLCVAVASPAKEGFDFKQFFSI